MQLLLERPRPKRKVRRGTLPSARPICYTLSIMLSRITATGSLVLDRTRSAYDEVMLHCARVGFKP